MKKSLLALVMMFGLLRAGAYDLVVAKDGSGNYTTVQAAINAVPTGLTVPFTIFIKNGKYKEKINIPSNKPFIQLTGESVANTILTYDDYAGRMLTCGTTVGTQNSAGFIVGANDFAASNITFENTFGDGSQAVTVLVNADRAVFKNCRFLGNQDTLYVKGSGTPKCYFKNCYIDGNVDFIFGSSIALFDSCVIYAKTRPTTSSSFITAPNTPNGQAYGFIFRDARLPNNVGGTLYFLSRPWPSPTVADTRQKTIFLSSRLSSHIQHAGWTTWDANTVTSNLYYAEYKSRYHNGAPVDISARVPWSFQASQADSSTYTFSNIFGTWDPCATVAGICNAIPTEIAVSNFRGTKGSSNSVFNWNISWPLSGINYQLFRSTDNISYTPVYSVTATEDTSVNFTYTDATLPPSGSIYKYFVRASKTGYTSHTTDTIQISSAPTLVVNASASLYLCGFSQAQGTPSAAQTYTISGTNLTNNISITPPVNYEVSLNQTAWSTNSSPLIIPFGTGTVTATTIYVRLNAPATGNYSGNIVNASTNANTENVQVAGSTVAAPTSFPLQYWPLTQNANDSSSARSPGVTASASTLKNLFLSDNTQPTASPTPAYSGQFGEALGATAQGVWTAVGGTLKRDYYQQFTITAASNYLVRIDSITFLASWYLTTSGTKMSVVYSKSGFTTNDSTEFSNGTGSSGSLVLSASGNFNRSFPILRNDAGPTALSDQYSLALNNNTGVSLNAGETLTIRLYFACSSTGTPRFAYVRNVVAKGIASGTLPLQLLDFKAVANEAVDLEWKTAQEFNTSHFTIERSADGRNFSPVGQVWARGSFAGNQYQFRDNYKVSAPTYYRLKLLDRDGAFTYSRIIMLNKMARPVSIYPNPAVDLIRLSHQKFNDAGQVRIFSADGREVLKQAIGVGAIQTLIDVQKLVPGVYQLELKTTGSATTQSFIKN